MSSAHFRTVWLSDIHLGNRDCKAEYLLDFLNNTQIDTLYLVGDIVDMWALSRQFRWPEAHNQVLHKLMSMSHKGTKVIYLPGNHDEPLQKYDGMALGKVEVVRQFIHTTADGRQLLILHGDQFDQQVCFGPLQAWIGDKGYDLLLFLNRWHNRIRIKLGFPYWSLAGYIKNRIQGATQAIDRFRNACVNRARELELDGVVCGHIHHPEISKVNDIEYHNDGDWIENCSALTETHCGHISLVYWTKTQQTNNLRDIACAKTTRSRKAA